MKQTIGIIGAGWLGQPLAQALIKQGHQVIATGQSPERLSQLAALGLAHHGLVLPQAPEILATLPVFKQQILIIAIPPQIKRGQANYPEKITNIVAAAELAGVEQLILLNSTAIANGLSGEVNEFSELSSLVDKPADKVAILAEAEHRLLAFKGDSRILRLAGLVGPKRHPGRFISPGRKFVEPEQPVNLIHQADVIGLLQALLVKSAAKQLNPEHRVYHGVSRSHQSRLAFYSAAAQALSRPAPHFTDSATNSTSSMRTGKLITDDWTRQQLDYQYQYDDLLAWLTD